MNLQGKKAELFRPSFKVCLDKSLSKLLLTQFHCFFFFNISARLTAGLASTGGSELGKRKNRDDGEGGPTTKKKIYVPVKEHPGVNFLGLLIGPRGATQKQLQASTGAIILIRGRGAQKEGTAPSGNPDDDDELHVSIEGTEEAVAKAQVEVEKILFNPEQAMKLKSEQLTNLAELNGREQSTTTPSNFGVFGTTMGSKMAGVMGAVIGSGPTLVPSVTIEITVPHAAVGIIIGKGGENSQKMQSLSGARMHIAKEDPINPTADRSISLVGGQGNVEDLKKRIEDLIQSRLAGATSAGGDQPSSHPGLGSVPSSTLPGAAAQSELRHAYVIKMPIPNDKIGLIIGKGGTTIKPLQERTGAKVLIPTQADADNPAIRTISIGCDTKEGAEAAQLEVYLILQQQQMQQQQQHQQQQQQAAPSSSIAIIVPDEKVGTIIGRQGCIIKDIQARTMTKIIIPTAADPGSNPPYRTVNIVGPPEGQLTAKYELENILLNGPNARVGGGQYGAYGAVGGYPSSGFHQQQAYGMGVYMPQQQPQQQQQPYGSYYGGSAVMPTAAAPLTTAAVVDPSAAVIDPNDPKAYYGVFWQYASYYGEAAARAYYGDWSPPVGTPPPPGIVVAPDPSSTSPAVATTATTTISSSTAAATAAVSTATAVPATSTLPSATATSEPSSSSSSASTTTAGNGNADGQGAQPAAQQATGDAAASATPVSQEEAHKAWEAYQAQYREWYEAHGKAAGADPNPPMNQ